MMTNKDIAVRLSLKDGEKTKRQLKKLGDEGQAALARIERQSVPASKGLLAVSAVTGDLRAGLSSMAGRMGPIGVGLSALGPVGVGAAAGLAAVTVSVVALSRASIRAAEEIANIGDEAKQAGAGVEAFQELTYAAEKYSVSQEALTDGLKELNLRADEFVKTGKGSAAEAFERLGYTQRGLQEQLGNTDQMFLDIVERMQGLEGEAARIRVADEIFGGTGGEQFVRMIAAGEAAIRGLMNEAREAGYVLDETMIRRADETRDKMNQLSRMINMQLNSALVDLAPIALAAAEAFAEVAKFVSEVVDGFRDLENQSTRGLEKRLVELNQFFAQNPAAPSAGNIYTAGQRHNWLENDAERKRIEAELKQRAEARVSVKTNTNTITRTGAEVVEADRIKKVTDALRFQKDQLDRTEVGRRVFVELQKAGIDGSHREARAIADLVIQIQAEERVQKDAKTITERLKTARDAYEESLRRINELVAAEAITEQTASAAREEATRIYKDAERQRLQASTDSADGVKRALMDIQDAQADTASAWEAGTHAMYQAGREAFVGITSSAGEMSDALENIFNDLQRRLAGALYDNTIGSVFDNLIGGLMGSVFGAFHSGGQVGGAAPLSRSVSPLAFVGAPRYHSGGINLGLRQDEVPIIAQRGEAVLTEAQQRHTADTIAGLAAMASSQPAAYLVPPKVIVNNNAGRVAKADARATRASGGGWNIEVMVEELENRMGRRIARGGGLAPALEGRYGLDPAYGVR